MRWEDALGNVRTIDQITAKSLRRKVFLMALVKAFVALLWGFAISLVGPLLIPFYFARDSYRNHIWPWEQQLESGERKS